MTLSSCLTRFPTRNTGSDLKDVKKKELEKNEVKKKEVKDQNDMKQTQRLTSLKERWRFIEKIYERSWKSCRVLGLSEANVKHMHLARFVGNGLHVL